jgi:hypothetical protein
MVRRMIVLVCGLTLCLGLASCRPIATSVPRELLKVESLKSIDAIPVEYGSLVGVTQRTPESALLWFEKADKTIVIVGLQARGSDISLAETVTLIPRSTK